MENFLSILVRSALLLCVSTAAVAQDSYYNRDKEKGWYWYEIEPLPVEPEPEPELPPPPEEPIIVLKAPEAPPPESFPEPEGPAALSSAWLKENLESYLHAAMDDPSPENVKAYLYLHRLMMDKASGFADASHVALSTEPMLSNDLRRPRFDAVSSAMSKEATRETRLLLRQIASDGQYVLVMSSKCTSCPPFITAARTLAKQSGADLDLITTDGGLPDNLGVQAADVRSDPRLVRALDPIATPSLYLVKADGSKALVTASAAASTEMERHAINVAYANGWISESAYQSTRPRKDVHIALEPGTDLPSEYLEDPEKLTEYLRARMTTGALQ